VYYADQHFAVVLIERDGSEDVKVQGKGKFKKIKEKFEIAGPPSPLSGPSENDLVVIEVVLGIKDKPKEVGWKIHDSDDNVVEERKAGTYKKNESVSHLVELESGIYRFTMDDSENVEGKLRSRWMCSFVIAQY
jgi:hypothetical protein